MSDGAFLILFLSFTAFMGIVPFGLRKFGIPSVISLLIVGMIIGPTGLDLIGKLSGWLSFLGKPGQAAITIANTTSHFTSLVDSLGALGLMFLMALAGMEADFKLIKSTKKPVTLLSILTFLVPAITGYLVYRHFCPDDLPGKLLYASLFASHSVGIVFPIMRDLGLSKTRFGASVLISTVITDIASIILLAVSVQLFRQNQHISHMVGNNTLSIFDHVDGRIFGNTFILVFFVIVILYLIISTFAVNIIGKKLLKWFNPSEDMLITIILLLILVTVIVGELFGINLVVGAFIAGLGLSKLVKEQDMVLFRRFESIGYGFLIPFLFVSIGMKTDFSVFNKTGSWNIVLLTVIFLIVSKVGSGFISMKLSGFKSSAGLAAGLMTVPQLSATLAAAAIGKDMGILSDNFFNAIIILSIVTTLPIPTLVKLVISKGKVAFDEEQEIKLPQVVRNDEML